MDKKEEINLMCAIRLALTGKANGLPIDDIISFIGPDEAARRIYKALEVIKI